MTKFDVINPSTLLPRFGENGRKGHFKYFYVGSTLQLSALLTFSFNQVKKVCEASNFSTTDSQSFSVNFAHHYF